MGFRWETCRWCGATENLQRLPVSVQDEHGHHVERIVVCRDPARCLQREHLARYGIDGEGGS